MIVEPQIQVLMSTFIYIYTIYNVRVSLGYICDISSLHHHLGVLINRMPCGIEVNKCPDKLGTSTLCSIECTV